MKDTVEPTKGLSIKVLAFCTMLLAAGGCGTTANKPPKTQASPQSAAQFKITTARHWDNLAKKIANDLDLYLQEKKLSDKVLDVQDISLDDSDSEFGRALHRFITTELVRKGYNVPKDGYGLADGNSNKKIDVEFEFQVIKLPEKTMQKHGIPRREIIVTTSLSQNGYYLQRNTGTYFIDDKRRYMKAGDDFQGNLWAKTPLKSIGITK